MKIYVCTKEDMQRFGAKKKEDGKEYPVWELLKGSAERRNLFRVVLYC